MKIRLPVDGSDFTKRMLAYVAAHDEMFGDSHDYVVVTVVPPVPPLVTHYVQAGAIHDYQSSQAEDVLAPVLAFARQKGWKVRASHVVGQAADAIAAGARRERPDLVVM